MVFGRAKKCPVCGKGHTGKFGVGVYCGLRCSKAAGAIARWGTGRKPAAPRRIGKPALRRRPAVEKTVTVESEAESDTTGGSSTSSGEGNWHDSSSDCGGDDSEVEAVCCVDAAAPAADGLRGELVRVFVPELSRWVRGVVLDYVPFRDAHRIRQDDGTRIWVRLRGAGVHFLTAEAA